MACKYTINGKEYSLAEFKAYLVNGGLDSLYPDNKYPWAKGKESKKEVKSNFGFDASLRFADLLLAGQSFDTIVQARKALTDQNIVAGTIEAKQADEAIELAGVLAGKQIVNKGLSESQTFDALVKLADQMPSLNVRTSTSIEQQAYSTPLPLAYLASELAGITEKTTVTESTAGNGALLIAANPELATVNELNPDRARSLKEQGFNVTTENAVTHSFTKNGLSDVVIINPPFGTVKDDSGNTITYSIKPMYSTNEVDHAIVMNTLKGMDDDGKAVLIIGGPAGHLSQEGRSDAYNGKAKRTFFYNLYNDYNVVDHFTVSGKLYTKQGAAWPVDVIVIHGKDKSKLRLPAADVPRVINTIEELKNELPDNRPSVSKAEITIDKAQSNSTETGDAGSNLGIRQFSNRRRSENRKRVGVLFRPERSIEANGQIIESNVDESNNNTSNRPVRFTNKPNTVENKFQADYTPASIVNPVGTLVPVNMQLSIEKALQRIINTHGDIDGYVANLLNYKKEEIGKYFSAEQVDAIALALDNIISGKGFIIGDQTGVGKGRVNAAMIRYAILNKMTPIFVTEKPNLYGDMLRDLSDIGMPDVKPFATNSGENIPIDNEANAWYEESLKAKENGEKIPEKRGKFISMPSGKKQEQNMNSMIDSGKLSESDVIFTTYNQMQTVKGEITTRTKFLRKLADGCLLILDESHNAGGTSAGPKRGKSAPEEGEKTGRAAVARELVSLAKGVFYSSATYAKRPDVLDLYSKTDMGLVADTASLQQAMVAGGVPLQQAVASMLAESGQYIRREKSFDGIVYGTSFVDVDRNFAEKVAEVMRDIMIFDDLKSVAVSTLKDEAKASASQISVDNAIGKAGIDSQNFTSIMHNMIGQMLLMLKVQPTIDEALEVLKRGEKPVIALSNTMGSVIKEYADEVGLNVGDVINLNCGDLLSRYLERSRRITETDVMGNKVKRSLDDDELGKAASSFYKKIQSKINNFDFSSYKMSPIDAIHNALAKEGYKSGEITGRMNIIDYSGDVPIYKIRPAQELSTAGKRKTVNDFNNGKLDVIILNQSGATGLSLHASPKVGGDTRKRHMIIAQPELNIDTHMQMLGRINRTGQIHLPSYSQLTANIPAEKRPSAILAKKMAMLNANTTAGKESAVKAKDVPDFMNDYGNEIAALVMTDNPEIHKMLGKPLAQGNNGLDKENAMAKVTGRIPVLKLKDQEMLYQMIEDEYNDYIEILTKTGQNQLEAHAMDLDAKIVHTENIVEELGGSTSPFAAGVEAEIVDVKKLGKPYTIDQINSLLEKTDFKDEKSSYYASQSFIKTINEEYEKALSEIEKIEEIDDKEVKRKQALKDNLEHQRNQLVQMFSNFYPSKPIVLTAPHGLEYEGIVGKFERKGQAKSFFAQGQWKMTVYVADATRQVTLPLSKLSWGATDEMSWTVNRGDLNSIKTALAEGQSTSREHRVILTGNMLAAYGFDSTGQIINYTNDKGEINQGVLMPKKFDLKQAIEKQPVIFSSPDIALDYINNSNATNRSIRSSNNDFRLMVTSTGATLYAPSSKAKGSIIFGNKRVTEIIGPFITRGKEMQAKVSIDEIESLLRVIYPIIGSMQPILKEEGKKFLESKGIKFSKTIAPNNAYTKSSLNEAIKSVMDKSFGDGWTNRLMATGKFKIISSEEAVNLIGNNDINIEAKYSKDGKAIAFYNPSNDTTYFIHDNIDKNTDLKGLMKHEIAVHALQLGKTNEQFKAILTQFEKLKDSNPKIKEAFARVPSDTKPDHVTEEALAYFLEHNANSTLAQKFIEFFRQILRKLTNNVAWANKLTEQELRNMATDALRSAPDTLAFDNVGRENEAIMMGKGDYLAPNGKPSNLNAIQYAQVRTPEFKKWFGDWENDPENASKVVDENGEPLVVYHKTKADEDFTEFDPNKSVDGWEIHFGTKEAANKLFLSGTGDNQRIIPVFLNIRVMPHTNHDDGHWGIEQLKQMWAKYWSALPIEGKRAVKDKQIADGIEEWGTSYGKYLYYKAIDMANAGKRVNVSKFMADEMYKYGLTGMSYRNAFEDKESTSYIVMQPNQIKSAVGNTGAFNEKNNDIRYSKQSPTEIANTLKDFFEPTQGKQELGWLAGFFQRNHLIDFVSNELPEINNYKLLAQEKDNFVNKNERHIAEQYDSFKQKMDAKTMHELGRVQGLATRLYNFDPANVESSDPMSDEEREVFEAYSALPTEAKEVYEKMREDYRYDLKTKKLALIDRIKQFKADDRNTAKIIKKIENHFDKFINKGVYFPLNRDGNIIVSAIDPDKNKVVHFVESNKERDDLIKGMTEQGYTDIKSSLKQTINKNVLVGNAANEIVALADKTVNDLRESIEVGEFNEKEISKMFDEFNQLLLNTLPDTSYRKHFIHRKGTLGESTDALRAYAKTRNSATRNIASLQYDSQIRDVLQQARKDVRKLNLDNTQALDSVLNELEKREEALANTETNVASQILTSLGFIGALGFNIGSAAVNTMQVAGVTFPELAGRYSTNEAFSEIQKAYKLLFNPAVLNKKSGFDLKENPAISEITKQALQRLSDIGKIDLTMTHDAISAGQNPSYSENIINKTVGNFAKYSGYLFHVAEALNRQVTAIATFNLAYAKNNGDFESAIAEAVDVIDRTQFDYGAGNRARYMMGNTARVLTLFKTYALGISYYIGRNVHNSLKGETPEVRLQARKILAVQMAITFTTSGVFGLPLGMEAFMALGGVAGFKYKGANFTLPGAIGGAIIFQALLAGLGADDDDDVETEFRNWLTDNFGETTAEWVTKGPARLLPIGDLSGRTGQRHLWWQPQNKQLEGKDQFNAFASAFMGPIGSQVASIFTAKQMYDDGQYSRMVESMTPSAMKNVLAAYRMSTEGVKTMKGQKIVERNLTLGETINKAIGFTPSVIVNAYDANSAIGKASDKYEMAKTHLVNRYINADKIGRAKLLATDIKDFNATVTPAERITMKTLLKSMKSRKTAGKHTKHGLYLPKKQEHLRELGRFAETQ